MTSYAAIYRLRPGERYNLVLDDGPGAGTPQEQRRRLIAAYASWAKREGWYGRPDCPRIRTSIRELCIEVTREK